MKMSVHILGSEEPILVKSLKPPAEKFIKSLFLFKSIPNAVPTIVRLLNEEGEKLLT